MRLSNLVRDVDGWSTLSSQPHFRNDHLEVVTDEVCSPARREPRSWTVVHRKAAVVVAPITADGRLVLIRQERVAVRAALWEMPAGQIDGTTQPSMDMIREAALRELREETGYELATSGELIPLGDFFSSPGFTDEHAYLLVAHPVVPALTGPSHSESESIVDCRAFEVSALTAMIASNEIRDANTLSIYARMVCAGIIPSTPANHGN